MLGEAVTRQKFSERCITLHERTLQKLLASADSALETQTVSVSPPDLKPNPDLKPDIVKAQGWVVNAEGAVMLIAQESNQSALVSMSAGHCPS